MSKTFDSFGLAEPILRAVTELGYREPTPIQVQAIPVVLQGRDVMGAAQTGTGKTAGFALPILQRLMPHANTSASPARHPVRALILAPTRELADQLHESVRQYAKYSGLRSAVVFGGVDIKPQIAALRQGCEVLIATPGRLLDHMGQKTVSLAQAEILVLDEADRMLDMGFLPDIQRILNALPDRRQNLMFSATFSSDIRRLASSFLNDPEVIEVARRNATAENVEQRIYRVADLDAKRAAVAQLVRERELSQVIVFTNTKIGAGRLARLLERDGLNSAAIHGDKSQQERLATLEAFKKGEIVVLVATDVAARGLDIAELPAVINYDLPYNAEDYVHRIGRTGRAGASGLALSLMTNDDERYLGDIEKLLGRKLAAERLEVAASARTREGGRRESGAERRTRSARPAHGGREASRHTPLAGYSNDPFFFEPYVPAAPSTASEAPAGVERVSATRRARRPVAVVAGNVETSMCITNCLYGALGVMASGPPTMNNFTFGNERYQYYETISGGSGAGGRFDDKGELVGGFDGTSVVQTHMTNSRLTDPEILETRYPVRLESFEIRAGSGGEGRWRGGDGAVRRVRFLEPMTASILANGRVHPAFGAAGGSAGAPGADRVERADGSVERLRHADSAQLEAGDVFVVETPGGGGFGDARG